MTFAELLRKERNPAVRSNSDDLREYANLRNAIVHAGTRKVLANPTDEAISDINRIRRAIEEPPRIDGAIGRRQVVTCGPSVLVLEATGMLVDGNFSQIPVYDGRAFVALLTAETIARWVGAMLQKHDGLLEDAPVSEVLAHTEDADNTVFMPPSASVFEALDSFDAYSRRGKTLDAMLVSEGARRDASPLNIATIYDVPALVRVSRGE